MDTEFAQHQGISWKGDVGVVNYGGGDKSMIAMFYYKPVVNPAKSTEAGRPIYEDRIYVRIHPPGERLNIVDREATATDKNRFPTQFRQFLDNAPQTAEGTPVEMLFPANPSTAAALKASGVHTVEQLAELSAHAIESIGMGCQQWVNEATRYLEVANKGVKASQLKQLLSEKDREINNLKTQIGMLQTELNTIRERSEKAVTLEDVQLLLANQGGKQGGRPVYVPGKQLAPQFDAQSAQIAATHITHDLAPKAKKKATPGKRERVRVA